MINFYDFKYSMRNVLNTICAASVIALLAACGGGGSGATGGAGSIPAPADPVVGPPVHSDATGHDDVSQRLYVTYFGRPAAPGELSALSTALRQAAAPTTLAGLENVYETNAGVRQLVDAFALTKEWKDQFASTGYIGDDFSFVSAVHSNLFNRKPEIEVWERQAQSIHFQGQSRTRVGLSIAASAKGADADLAASKSRTAGLFTRALVSAGVTSSYAGPVEFSMARALLQDIGSEPDSTTAQGQLDATVQALSDMAAGRFAEESAAPRKVILMVGADQAAVQANRLATLASAMSADLSSRLGSKGPAWNFVVLPAASTAYKVREQLLDAHGAILIGDVPIPKEGDRPALDAYRLPKCKAIQFSDGATQIIPRTSVIEAQPGCSNGLTVSVLRGTNKVRQTSEISRKLDQMIAYHKNSQAANAGWERRYTLIEGLWGGGTPARDVSAFWDSIGMFDKDKNTTLDSGSGAQRRSAFLACLASSSEMCKAYVHGSPASVRFEGPGASGVFYSPDAAILSSDELQAAQIKTKYVEMVSCSSQDFLTENSFGTTLLMGGNALLTNGSVSVILVSDRYEEHQIKNQYFLLNAGATFADAWLGQAEHGPDAFQGDPYITMRPVADAGNRPILVINGKRYNSGSAVVPVDFPDSLFGRQTAKLIVLSNHGTADMHVRIDSGVTKTAVNVAAGDTTESEYGHNAQYVWGDMLASRDGRVERPTVEPDGGRLPVTIKPGASVAYRYDLEVRLGADGKPKRTGTYFGEVQVLSNDPGSARLHLALRGRVR